MRRIFSTILILLALLEGAEAQAQVLLHEIAKEEGLATTRLFLRLSELPEFEVKTSGQRVDLFLTQTQAATSLGGFPEDGKVIKVLLGRQQESMMVSFLLQTVPKHVKALTDEGGSRLILELAWERGRAPTRLAIASAINGLPLPRRGGEAGSSFLSGGWRAFLAEYEAPLVLKAQLRYSLPPLSRLLYSPLAEGENGAALQAGLSAGQKGDWEKALTIFRRLSPELFQGVDREALMLFHGEALARTGNFLSAGGTLEEFLKDFPGSSLKGRARYLLAHVRAAAGDPYDASYQLSLLGRERGENLYYAHLEELMQAEILLATGRKEKALALLESALPPERLANIFTRRLADAMVLAGRDGEALPLYRGLEGRVGAWGAFPFSLSRMAEALYRQEEPLASARRYAELADVIPGREKKALALFAQARGGLRGGGELEAVRLLRSVAEKYANTEGGRRSQMLLLDQAVLIDEAGAGQGQIPGYRRIAAKAASREVREEAAFKAALLVVVNKPDRSGMLVLEDFLKQYGSGPFRRHSEALLAEALPQVIRTLIAGENFFDALVLVEKHRHLLGAASVKADFLVDLGNAFRRLGLLEKAAKIYFYMLDAYRGAPAEKPFFLPLVQALFEQGKYRLAVEYADRYLERYSDGGAKAEVLALKVRALYGRGMLDEAAKILTSGGLPPSLELSLLAGQVYWGLGDLEKVEEILAPALADAETRSSEPRGLAQLAEALFLLGRGGEALPLYGELLDREDFSEQALYRSAQIHLAEGQREEGLNLLRRLAEEGVDPQWKKVAESLLLGQRAAGT